MGFFWLITSYVKKVAFPAVNLGAINMWICIKMIKNPTKWKDCSM